MQRHAEGHGHLWQKQAIVLNEQLQQQQQSLKTDSQAKAALSITQNSSATSSTAVEVAAAAAAAATTTTIATTTLTSSSSLDDLNAKSSTNAKGQPVGITGTSGLNAQEQSSLEVPVANSSGNVEAATPANIATAAAAAAAATTSTTTTTAAAAATTVCGKPNDWVVIPVFADIVKLALAERENCLQW
ncbi:GH17228 [Drosophila grimshawi]|uniref:GH17228 n=1 Tax=Drosophila grimshawi TaxID=7222 RepID=B4K1L0_DROGR|nr:GH17228 [Drosophila grimshawi]